jgi:uridine kinase
MTSLIGIAGGTGAGKTLIAGDLVDRFGGAVIDLDSYYLDRSAWEPEERRRLNYDEPGAIDVDLVVEHLRRLAAGEAIEKPVYSFDTHTRVATETLSPARLVVVEGLFTLWWESLRRLLHLKIFVDAPADIRLIRRLRRDIRERGRLMDHIVAQYVGTVRPMHDRYVEPSRVHADYVVVNDGPLEGIEEQVAAQVRELMSGRRGGAPAAGAGRI